MFSSQTIVRGMKPRKVSWTRCVAYMRQLRNLYSPLVGKFKGNILCERIRRTRIVLNWILNREWTG